MEYRPGQTVIVDSEKGIVTGTYYKWRNPKIAVMFGNERKLIDVDDIGFCACGAELTGEDFERGLCRLCI